MCKVNPRRLAPKAADSVNGETLIYNSTTGYCESTPASPFDPTADQAITGTWSFNKPINLKVLVDRPPRQLMGIAFIVQYPVRKLAYLQAANAIFTITAQYLQPAPSPYLMPAVL